MIEYWFLLCKRYQHNIERDKLPLLRYQNENSNIGFRNCNKKQYDFDDCIVRRYHNKVQTNLKLTIVVNKQFKYTQGY